ncbi:C-X-C motif chemokine 9-like [Neolamprologus brichardi]|uniref:C-X-C motif chemokine 9-like n=1 Tax=Neolamprologus brichardi TaxID=32507 RepID=UPI0016438134|nr:C-X-C motif chemokine 9-like [Neolamprologus brichardi]XP_039857887.1 C-X-C motif chemokine 9-like [Simochromis diagramma]
MKLNPQSVCAFAILSLCCVLITVRESNSTFIPGRCVCPKTQQGVRGQLKALKVLLPSSTCHNVTVIVTLQRNNKSLCLNPEAPMAKQLIRCWLRVQQLGRDVKLCLQRKKRRGGQRQQTRQRRKGQNRKVSS